MRKVVFVDIEGAFLTKSEESLSFRLIWFLRMDCFVKVVVHNFAKINESPFLKLHLNSSIKFQPRGVHKANISDEVLPVDLADH